MAVVICPYEGSKFSKGCRQLSCEWVTAAKMDISRTNAKPIFREPHISHGGNKSCIDRESV